MPFNKQVEPGQNYKHLFVVTISFIDTQNLQISGKGVQISIEN